jgi:hypothetical protein
MTKKIQYFRVSGRNGSSPQQVGGTTVDDTTPPQLVGEGGHPKEID